MDSFGEIKSINNASRYSQINYGEPLPINFEYKVYDLAPETRYYFRSYLIANDTLIYGEEMSFITKNLIEPKVRTFEAIAGENSILFKGEIKAPGTQAISEYGIAYGTNNSTQNKVKASDAAINTYPTTFEVSVNNFLKAPHIITELMLLAEEQPPTGKSKPLPGESQVHKCKPLIL
jgi:hypothetical protein